MKTKPTILTVLNWLGVLMTSLGMITNLTGATNNHVATSSVSDVTFTRVTGAPWDTELGDSWSGTVGDYNGDGYLDIVISRYRIGRTALYHNNGDGTFRSVTNSTFPRPVGDSYFCTGSDLDNDGRVDLFEIVSGTGLAVLYYNNGDETFAQVPLGTVYPFVQSAVDYDHDGLLDLYVTRGGGDAANRLYRNLGGRSFQAMPWSEVGDILGMGTFGNAAWADYDDDGWEDLVTPDFLDHRRLFVYRNTGAGRFEAVTSQITTDTFKGFVANWGDYDNDGRVDFFVAGDSNALFRNVGGTNFERMSMGVSIEGFCNGASWGDYNNDGFLDLFITGFMDGNFLFRNNGDGTFSAVTTGPVVTDRVTTGGSYAGLWFDYDNDGFLDLFVPNGDDWGTVMVPNFLYHNNGNANAWLKVKLVGAVSNRDAAGAKVRMQATFGGATRWQRRDITSGGDPYGGSGPIAHFGLRDATRVETVRVEWPSGHVTELTNVGVNQMLTVTEPPGLKAASPEDGQFQFDLIGQAGQSYDVSTSSNLTDWVLWQTVVNTSRVLRLSDPSSAALSHRFYQATPAPTNVVSGGTRRAGEVTSPGYEASCAPLNP